MKKSKTQPKLKVMVIPPTKTTTGRNKKDAVKYNPQKKINYTSKKVRVG